MFASSHIQFLPLACALLVGCGGTQPPIAPARPDDVRLTLDQTNTRVDWVATKRIVGKTVQVEGGWDDRGSISGVALLAADGGVRQLTATIEVASLWTANDTLTEVMLKPETGFFAIRKHPNATFISTAIKAVAANTNATHVVEGLFQLNGIQRPITFPATMKTADGGLQLDAVFNLNRQEYNIRIVNTPAGLMLGDQDIIDEVAVTVKIETAGSAAGAVAAKPVDIASLPKTFTQTVEVFQVHFDMVLVPGDESQSIRPLYVGKNEVTWDEFMPWVYTNDIPDPAEAAKLRFKKLRPSLPYGDVTRGYGGNGFPALSMSKLSAELYCKWLGKQTGKNYRLPTEKEWEHFNRLGRGGKAPTLTEEEADKFAVFVENSFVEESGICQSRPAGSMLADAIGLHDVAGSVAEWVTETGKLSVVRGGHFIAAADQLGANGRFVEDQEVWNRSYPDLPRSIWWFVDAQWTGFRVVCDP
jgi:sulfatase modifying factor 1